MEILECAIQHWVRTEIHNWRMTLGSYSEMALELNRWDGLKKPWFLIAFPHKLEKGTFFFKYCTLCIHIAPVNFYTFSKKVLVKRSTVGSSVPPLNCGRLNNARDSRQFDLVYWQPNHNIRSTQFYRDKKSCLIFGCRIVQTSWLYFVHLSCNFIGMDSMLFRKFCLIFHILSSNTGNDIQQIPCKVNKLEVTFAFLL